jgi:hypothetical protein
LPLGSVGYENAVNLRGERLIWLDPRIADKLTGMHGPGESHSDVIMRLAEIEAAKRGRKRAKPSA